MRLPLLYTTLLAAALAVAAPTLHAQASPCLWLDPSELKPLLGPSVVAKPSSTGCHWSVAGSPKKLLAMPMKASGTDAEYAFAGARRNVPKEDTATDQPGVGDKAFAVQTSFGVSFIVLRRLRLVQFQYWTGAAGTAKDVTDVRPIVKKAIGAF